MFVYLPEGPLERMLRTSRGIALPTGRATLSFAFSAMILFISFASGRIGNFLSFGVNRLHFLCIRGCQQRFLEMMETRKYKV